MVQNLSENYADSGYNTKLNYINASNVLINKNDIKLKFL